jgi:hypothetical protein
MTPGFRGYTMGNASTPPNRTRINTDFSMDKVKHEVHSILAFNLTITNNVAATKIT